MKRFTATVRQLSLVAAAALFGVTGAVAQSYYDDDIYYDASKAPKKEVKKQQPRQQPQQQTLYYYDGSEYVPWTQAGNYPAASEYAPTGSSTRDVDEYNRRGAYAQSERPDSISLAEFEQMSAMSNTERLARFHDSQAAQEASGTIAYDDLGNEYYADNNGGGGGSTTIVTVPTSSVSLNFGVGYPYYYNSWYGGWPYYSYSWPYSSWYWNDWYGPGWGPSWAWGPSWSWGWGAPCPPHHHHLGWGVGRYYNNPPGATRPNRPIAGGSNGNRYYGSYGSSANRGSVYNSNGRRPSSSAAGSVSRPATSTRPGYSAPISRPTTGTTPAGSYSGGRGRASSTYKTNGSSTSGNRHSTPGYNTSGSRRPSSTPSYSGSRGSSSGGYSGSRGGYSGGGGSRSGGGGYSGSRGRR